MGCADFLIVSNIVVVSHYILELWLIQIECQVNVKYTRNLSLTVKNVKYFIASIFENQFHIETIFWIY